MLHVVKTMSEPKYITCIALHASGVVKYALWGVSNHRTRILSSTPNIKKKSLAKLQF